MEEFRECLWCGDEITEGRSDKDYCDKACYNAFKNDEMKEMLRPIKEDLKAYKSSYIALRRLADKYGTGSRVPLSEAIQLGLDYNAPYRLARNSRLNGEYTLIGNLGYLVNSEMKSIIINEF